MFVEIDDVENFTIDCDDKPRIPSIPPKKVSRELSSQASLSFVSSDDDSYETDLDFDEEGTKVTVLEVKLSTSVSNI